MHLAVLFETIGGYHAARLRAANQACGSRDWRFTAIEITNAAGEHPWGSLAGSGEFPTKTVLPFADTARSLTPANRKTAAARLPVLLDCLQPQAIAIPGWGFDYSRAALAWCRRRRVRAVLMSESKRDDEQRAWWKEWIKARIYVRRFHAALVGGRAHRDYLVELGLPSGRIFFGYDVVDNPHFVATAEAARKDPGVALTRQPAIPPRPYFIAATRFIPRKNVTRLVEAYADYRALIGPAYSWDLVICGSGVCEHEIRALITARGLAQCVHLPGFIPYANMGDWYGLAGALVHPAIQEQWGLVLNEACAASLPILASRETGAAAELVKDGVNGYLFDPLDAAGITRVLVQLHSLPSEARRAMGAESARLVARFDPAAFGRGLMQAIDAS